MKAQAKIYENLNNQIESQENVSMSKHYINKNLNWVLSGTAVRWKLVLSFDLK